MESREAVGSQNGHADKSEEVDKLVGNAEVGLRVRAEQSSPLSGVWPFKQRPSLCGWLADWASKVKEGLWQRISALAK